MPSQSASIQSYFPPLSSPVTSQLSSQSPPEPRNSSNNASSSRATTAALHGKPMPPDQPIAASPTFIPGDGFTPDELATGTNNSTKPMSLIAYNNPFTPRHGVPYKEVSLRDLRPTVTTNEGVCFTGRVLNVYSGPPAADMATYPNKAPRGAAGCVKCTVGDGEGVAVVRVWHSNQTRYPLHLGVLVTVWTTHVFFVAGGGHYDTTAGAELGGRKQQLYTSVFPERERGCHVQIHPNGVEENRMRCRKPLPLGGSGGGDHGGVQQMNITKELMTLAAFAKGGHERADVKVLVCVKSVGARKKVTRKDGHPTETTTIHLLDHTTASTSTFASLTLWGDAAAATTTWIPHSTVLLLTRLGCRVVVSSNNNNTNATPSSTSATGSSSSFITSDDATSSPTHIWLSLTAASLVEVDPCPLRDAEWLRGYARRLLLANRGSPCTVASCLPSSSSSSSSSPTAVAGSFPLPFPPLAQIESAEKRVLYRIADIDEVARGCTSSTTTTTAIGQKNEKERGAEHEGGGEREKKKGPPTIVGFMSVLLTQINLVSLYRRGALACGKCPRCGGAVFANAVVGRCAWCCSSSSPSSTSPTPRKLYSSSPSTLGGDDGRGTATHGDGTTRRDGNGTGTGTGSTHGNATTTTTTGGNPQPPAHHHHHEKQNKKPKPEASVPLELNPHILGPLIDETGVVAAGRLVVVPEAWAQLFGCGSVAGFFAALAEVAAEDGGGVSVVVEGLRRLEARMAWVRVTLVVGWVEGWGVGAVPVPVAGAGVGGDGDGDELGAGAGVGRLCVLGVRE
ncbi:nucleic acid-binding protein [Diplodia corticola]|uniref:Nucleic acid-binding protein n=1 Tax=Diplodia corticola TaxID=236234 RepID=A0A1J9RPA0_9PEZI|nr:nucleic acid-binding protein [Diplodia corticola]OJD29748.1 nucleic acid-binding protein [Diplodia corticola]